MNKKMRVAVDVVLILLFLYSIFSIGYIINCSTKNKEPEYHPYDLNQDGKVDISDLIKLHDYIMETKGNK